MQRDAVVRTRVHVRGYVSAECESEISYALQPAPRNRRRVRTGDEDEDEGDSPRASITITMRPLPSAALAPSKEYEDNGRKYWMRDARHRTGKRSIIHNECISFKSCESVKAHRVPGRPAAFADALSRLNFAHFTGCAIERDFSTGVREGEGFRIRKDERCDRTESETGRKSRRGRRD